MSRTRAPYLMLTAVAVAIGGLTVPAAADEAAAQPAGRSDSGTMVATTPPRWSDVDPGSDGASASAVAIDPVRNIARVAETDGSAEPDGPRFRTVSYELHTGKILRTTSYDDPLPRSDDSYFDGARDIAVDPSTGAFYVTGWVATPDGGFLTRTLAYSKFGRLMWTDAYEGAGGASVVVDAPRSTVYVRAEPAADPGVERYFAYHLLALDAATGQRRWTATRYEQAITVGGSSDDLAVDPVSGTVVVTGELNNGTTAATAAWSADGRYRWEVREPGERAVALSLGDGTVAVVGSKDDVVYTRSIALDSGDLRWQARTGDFEGWTEVSDVAIDSASQAVFVSGFTYSRRKDVLTLSLDDTGGQQWLRILDGPDSGAFHDEGEQLLVDPVRQVVHIASTIDNDIHPAGFDSPSDLGLVSYAAGDGRLLRVGQFSAGPDLYLHAADLDLDPDSGIVVAAGHVVFGDNAAVTVAYRAVA